MTEFVALNINPGDVPYVDYEKFIKYADAAGPALEVAIDKYENNGLKMVAYLITQLREHVSMITDGDIKMAIAYHARLVWVWSSQILDAAERIGRDQYNNPKRFIIRRKTPDGKDALSPLVFRAAAVTPLFWSDAHDRPNGFDLEVFTEKLIELDARASSSSVH